MWALVLPILCAACIELAQLPCMKLYRAGQRSLRQRLRGSMTGHALEGNQQHRGTGEQVSQPGERGGGCAGGMLRQGLGVVLGVALALLAAPLSAQAPDSTPVATISELRQHQLVRLAVSGLGRRQGRLVEPGTSELVLTTEHEPLRVPATRIDTVWTRGQSTLTGAAIGGLGLAAVGGLTLMGLGSDDTSRSDYFVGGAVAGLVSGALIGALVGTAIPRWKRRFP